MSIIHATTVQQWLDVTRRPLYEWNKNGQLPILKNGWYHESAIDAFLSANAHNFAIVPTAELLANGALMLVRLDAIQQRLGVSRSYARYLARTYLPQIQFPGKSGQFRVSWRDLVALADLMEHAVSAEWLASIVGITRQSVVRAVASGELMQVPEPESDRKKVYVSWATASHYVQSRLPAWLVMSDWVLESQHPDFGLVGLEQTAKMLGVSERIVASELNARYARYVATPTGRHVQVSRVWIAEQLAQEPAYSASDIARLFDATEETVNGWLRQGFLKCPIEGHVHSPSTPYLMRPCWIAYFRARCSPGYGRVAWHFVDWRVAQVTPPPLVPLDRACQLLRRTDQTILQWVQEGWLPGVLSPSGVWLFDSSRLSRIWNV